MNMTEDGRFACGEVNRTAAQLLPEIAGQRYRYRPLRDHKIRLLRLKMDTTYLCCTIQDSKSYAGNFTALSYPWGTGVPSEDHKIVIEGEGSLRLTWNLYSALLQLRASSIEPKIFWIDQISINQRSPRERSSQVRHMGEIYRGASQVVTWLGEKTPPESVQSFLRVASSMAARANLLNGGSNKSAELGNECPPDALDIGNLGMEDALDEQSLRTCEDVIYGQSGWSSRLWMLQENLLNKNIKYLWGNALIERQQIHALPLCQASGLLSSPQGFHVNSYGHAMKLVKRWRQIHSNGNSWSITRLVNDFGSQMNVSDDRDRIYALLGLCEKTWNIIPKYEDDLLQVYIDFVKATIRHTGNLDVFDTICQKAPGVDCFMSRPTKFGTKSWPTWVPVFTNHAPSPIQGRVTGSLLAKMRSLRVSGSVREGLGLRGLQIAKIESVVAYFPDECAIQDTMIHKNLIRLCNILSNARRALIKAGIPDVESQMCYMMTGSGCSLDPDMCDQEWDQMAGTAFITTLSALRNILEENAWQDQLSEIQIPKHNERFANLVMANSSTKNRTICLTTESNVVLAPRATAPGDILVALFGGRSLFVIRRLQDHYQLLGPAFTSSLMRGEVLNDQKWMEQVRQVLVQTLKGESKIPDKGGLLRTRIKLCLNRVQRGVGDEFHLLGSDQQNAVLVQALRRGCEEHFDAREFSEEWWGIMAILREARSIPTPSWEARSEEFSLV